MQVDHATGIAWTEHGSGVPVVVLHGFTVDHRLTLDVVESSLRDQPVRRLHLDLPGHGHSTGDGIDSADDVVDRVSAFLESTLGDTPRGFIGSSFGGAVSRALTGRAPDRSLGMALLAPMVIADHSARTLPIHAPVNVDRELAATVDPADWEDFASITYRQDRASWDLYVRDVLPGIALGDQEAIARIAAAYDFEQRPERGPAFTKPVTFVLGRQDPVVGWADADALADAYPRAKYVMVEAGHNPHHEQLELAGQAIAAWADEVLRVGDA